jgi:hypothetical protein
MIDRAELRRRFRQALHRADDSEHALARTLALTVAIARRVPLDKRIAFAELCTMLPTQSNEAVRAGCKGALAISVAESPIDAH